MNSKFYIGINTNEDIVKSSSSGGAFWALVSAWFKVNKNPHVCGCVMNDNLEAEHILAEKIEECIPMRGSKYIASQLNGVIPKIGDILANGGAVLFSGTPCQVYGLNSYLDRKVISKEKLFTVEVICHGVAQKKFFRDYISHLEKKYGGKAVYCNFRAKRKPGNLQDMQVKFDNGKVYNASSTKYDWFYSLYNNNNNNLSSGCYSCKFANPERHADMSLGDAWGCKENYGKSLILVNSQKGIAMLSRINEFMDLREGRLEETDQSMLFKPAVKPDNYDEFWQIYNEKGYLAAQKYVGNNTIKGIVKDKLAYVANELGVKELLKKVLK